MTISTHQYRKAYAVAKSIPYRANKRPAILFWCKCVREMLQAGS